MSARSAVRCARGTTAASGDSGVAGLSGPGSSSREGSRVLLRRCTLG